MSTGTIFIQRDTWKVFIQNLQTMITIFSNRKVINLTRKIIYSHNHTNSQNSCHIIPKCQYKPGRIIKK